MKFHRFNGWPTIGSCLFEQFWVPSGWWTMDVGRSPGPKGGRRGQPGMGGTGEDKGNNPSVDEKRRRGSFGSGSFTALIAFSGLRLFLDPRAVRNPPRIHLDRRSQTAHYAMSYPRFRTSSQLSHEQNHLTRFTRDGHQGLAGGWASIADIGPASNPRLLEVCG